MNALDHYSNDIGLFTPLTVESLINSHRFLRQENMKSNATRLAEFEKARKAGLELGRQEVLKGKYIEIAKIRAMTVKELVELLAEDGK